MGQGDNGAVALHLNDPLPDIGLLLTPQTDQDGATGNVDASLIQPLVIDLDGTLVRSNLLLECALAYLRTGPLAVFRMLLWLLRGRAYLKQQLAHAAVVDVTKLPLNPEVKAYALSEKQRGRKVFLATAADSDVAHLVANHCGFFDGVLASNGILNLKGQHKANALRHTFPDGFAYMGDSRADRAIWSCATEAIVVGTEGWARRASSGLRNPTRIIATSSALPALLESARPHQWAKNVLVFVPAVLSGVANEPITLATIVISFVALCIVASSTYLLNDLWDIQDDRKHWSKQNRPIPSGRLPIGMATGAMAAGLFGGLYFGFMISPKVGGVLALYTAITLAYSLRLKRVPVVDVVVLAGLFTLRLVIGIVAAKVAFSAWLLVFSMFLFSSLCFAKRYVEVERVKARSGSIRSSRGYENSDSALLLSFGTSTGVAAIVVFVLYIIFDAYARTFYGDTTWLWAFPIILFLWLNRIWLMAIRGSLDDDPVAFAVKDRASICLGGTMFVAFLLAWSGVFA